MAGKFEVHVTQLQAHRWAFRVVYMPESIEKIVQDLKRGDVVVVSGGSFKDKLRIAC